MMATLYRLAQFITCHVPLPVAYALGVFVADCHYAFSGKDRRAVEANLKAILKTDHVPPAMVREMFRNFGRYLAEFFTMTKYVDADFVRAHVQIDNSEYLNEALGHGKGCILVGGHLGNWEMLGAVLLVLGYPLSVIALPHKDPKVNKFFNDQREHFGATIIPAATTAVRRCVEHLKANRPLGILGDRDFGSYGIVMDFLGRPTMIPKGAAMFSMKTGAPILSCFFMRKDNGDFYASFGKPIYPPSRNGKATEEDLKALIMQYIPFIEDRIRQHPTQWLIFREFWVT